MPLQSPPAPPVDPARRAPVGAPLFAAVVAALAVLAWHAWYHMPFLADDALISLVYAERLVAGLGLTWSDGARVEGYSNLLWVLGCAGLGALGMNLIVAARLLGVAATVAVILACARLALRLRGPFDGAPAAGRAAIATFGAGALFAASGTVAVWAIGGLEQPLVAALLAWSIVLASKLAEAVPEPHGAPRGPERARAGAPLGVLLGLLCLTRPDAPLFVAAIVLGLVQGRPRAWRAALTAGALAALFVGAQLAFRWVYYADVVPNTAYAKLVLSTQRVRGGLDYLRGGLLDSLFVFVAGALGLCVTLARKATRTRGLMLLYATALWCAYVVYIGGDIFPAFRHLFVLQALAALAAVELWPWIWPTGLVGKHKRPLAALATLGLTCCVVGHGLKQALLSPANDLAKSERWEWDGAVIGRMLHTAFADEAPLIAVTAAGCLPYFSKLPAVDMLGLNDRHIARQRPSDFGNGYLGHELGDGAYVLEREPDLIFFCGALGSPTPCYRSGKELAEDPRFAAEYKLLRLEGTTPYTARAHVWARAAAGKLAPTRAPDGATITVPGFLFAGRDAPVAALDAAGHIGVQLAPGEEATFDVRGVTAGDWRATLTQTGGPVELALLRDAEDSVHGALQLRLRAGAAPAHVTEVRLERAAR
ncbi:MAG: hypothetical protein R3F49_12725 [Planctomycetota bacterium]